MKHLCLTLFATLICFYSRAQEPVAAATGVTYGTGTTKDEAISINELTTKIKDNSFNGKITAVVTEVCQEKGCWMKVQREKGTPMMVKFKNYGFFMPKNIVGKTVVLEGTASEKEISVEQLRHYAEDAGKSKKEINQIKKPQKDIQFTASGVLVL